VISGPAIHGGRLGFGATVIAIESGSSCTSGIACASRAPTVIASSRANIGCASTMSIAPSSNPSERTAWRWQASRMSWIGEADHGRREVARIATCSIGAGVLRSAIIVS
jgi:hypothetical protein